ncbi:hypothetical protein QE394_001118 [Arthrobacter sp. SORGH_AS 212]|uniref:hypothetical protein n=1 Tax=Pseudarthrobacter sp. SORGH_AS 212 TaxID=3041777 RepID=UPI00277F1A45|nr:hypothetical protein [Arthrobacter sp. SORGH_AS_0212]
MKTIAEVLIEHQRQSSSACLCGWSELGRSHPGHQAAALSAAGFGPVQEAKAQALRDAADNVVEIDGRPDYAARDWLRARADKQAAS